MLGRYEFIQYFAINYGEKQFVKKINIKDVFFGNNKCDLSEKY